jgi:hypothetical protein
LASLLRPIRNFVKFHLIDSVPSSPGARALQRGEQRMRLRAVDVGLGE